MAMFFSSRLQLISRQLSLSWNQLAVWRCVTTIAGQHCKFVRHSTSVKQKYSSVRHLCSSLPLCDVKQMANETTCSDDEPSPAEILANLSPEEEKRLKVLKLEYDVFMSTGVRVPDHVSDENWVHLLRNCPSPNSRAKYYRYLFKREKQTENDRRERAANRLKMEEKRKLLEQKKQLEAHHFLNTFLLYVREATMNQWYNNNLCYALMNGPHVVFDFSYEDEMNDQELTNLVRQMQLCHGDNKVDREPFHFHFCNFTPNGRMARKLEKAIPNLSEIPYTITDKHYLQCYDRSRIVYLSPNAPNYMTKFNPDDVYVIGCIVDKSAEKPLTFARAKAEKIRCVRFPLDQHVRWVKGSKSLTLNHVVDILLTLKKTEDWEKALIRNLPSRKFRAE